MSKLKTLVSEWPHLASRWRHPHRRRVRAPRLHYWCPANLFIFSWRSRRALHHSQNLTPNCITRKQPGSKLQWVELLSFCLLSRNSSLWGGGGVTVPCDCGARNDPTATLVRRVHFGSAVRARVSRGEELPGGHGRPGADLRSERHHVVSLIFFSGEPPFIVKTEVSVISSQLLSDK
jgi:hypothetical protein